MTNTKPYYISQADFTNQIEKAKLPPQQIQIYRALADLGKPTRGKDVVAHAVAKFGLITRQNYDVLAAWYFSPKRRPACVTLGVPAPVDEDLADKITRLQGEIDMKTMELLEAQEQFEAEAREQDEEDDEADTESEEEAAANEKARQEIKEAEAE